MLPSFTRSVNFPLQLAVMAIAASLMRMALHAFGSGAAVHTRFWTTSCAAAGTTQAATPKNMQAPAVFAIFNVILIYCPLNYCLLYSCRPERVYSQNSGSARAKCKEYPDSPG